MKVIQVSKDIYTINGFFSAEECDLLINQSEKCGYDLATVETEKGARLIDEVRNNQRVLYKDESFAVKLWGRVSPFVPGKIGNSNAIGLNELFRFYKYEQGQKFKRHIDESFIRNEKEASYYTFMIYLNDGFEGGETSFNSVSIKGERGLALFFLHSLVHEGMEVIGGVKYVLRTDIMYRLETD